LVIDERGRVVKASCAIDPKAPSSLLSAAAASASSSTISFDISIDGDTDLTYSSKDLIQTSEGGQGGAHISSILLHMSHLAAAATAAAAASAATSSVKTALSLSRAAQMQSEGGGWPLGILVRTGTFILLPIISIKDDLAGAQVVDTWGVGAGCHSFRQRWCRKQLQRHNP
jgi:hypothetical protein